MIEVWPPRTRLSVALALEGCTNFVSSPAPMEKLCQLMIALSVAWLTVTTPGAVTMVAAPDVTLPSVGLA